jgi:acyl carrier protein phosphodiesterase
MNYLAHALLSGNDHDLLVGNFIADHVRNSEMAQLPAGVIEGIMMHRRIDAFTDAHPAFRAAKRYFYKDFEKYSGILVDIYFDHLLAVRFPEYSKVPLNDFARSVYVIYDAHRALLPAGSARFLDYVRNNNIYHAYADRDGIQRVLMHLSSRIRHDVRLDRSFPAFEAHEEGLQTLFSSCFSDAIELFAKKTA